jgi:hypothetical protein
MIFLKPPVAIRSIGGVATDSSGKSSRLKEKPRFRKESRDGNPYNNRNSQTPDLPYIGRRRRSHFISTERASSTGEP